MDGGRWVGKRILVGFLVNFVPILDSLNKTVDENYLSGSPEKRLYLL